MRTSATGWGKRLKAAADGDDPGPDGVGQVAKSCKIKAIAISVDGGRVGGQPVKTGTAGGVVGDVAANAARRGNDAVAGFASAMKP